MARYAHSKAARQLMFDEVAKPEVCHRDSCEWVTRGGRCTCGFNERLLAVKTEADRKLYPAQKQSRNHRIHA